MGSDPVGEWVRRALDRVHTRLLEGGAVEELRILCGMSDNELLLLAEREAMSGPSDLAVLHQIPSLSYIGLAS